ncbi:oxygen-independent coproporphyrinogen III oxidase [Winogradskyella jejuensis]|uniref:Coproporphyrinogen-III oxidase n=1 Tax=Winogradskyella jejuensis TaxID=1089305 RepID=A0A1M5KPP1_9FLAO|nr:oxygen-independent coproporphyrinogen III oxidase [Winogradskyella jejuensis]SHG54774.1 oxygen-independent coproporphyrinogen-3 oxidase [Winogradskyella jejuensis]
MSNNLVTKYNIAGPRYTSYPTVPYWDNETFSKEAWKKSFLKTFNESEENKSISLYIHLPFCEQLCTFCGCNKRITKNHKVETPYLESVLKEWQLYIKLLDKRPIINELHLGGGTPTFFSPENLSSLINGIFGLANRAPEASISFEGHPNNTTFKHLETLKALGFNRVSYGVQDYNQNVQKAINRIQPFENVKRVTEQARALGYNSVGHDIIFGLPFQTKAHILHTIERTKELLPDRIAFYSYAHVPWIKGNGQRGFKDSDLPSADEKRAMYEIGKEKLLESGYVEIGMDHFALRTDSLHIAMEEKSMHRNFMGYTNFKTQLMIGLGVSAISDSWSGFAQNLKTVEAYQASIEKNELAVFRGHILNQEDLIIRKHILNLMCSLYTSWSEEEYRLIGIYQIKETLKEMERDELIKIEENSITVLESGRPFVRNVCMAFDLRLQRAKPETQLFSMTI